MGSFSGHIMPGIFSIIFACWCTICILCRYSRTSKNKRNTESFKSFVLWPVLTKYGWIHVDGYILLAAGCLGTLVEFCAPPLGLGSKDHIDSGVFQHATLYFFFAMIGFLTIMAPCCKNVISMGNVTYIALIIAYVTEGLLFHFHLFGRDGIDVMLHTLLVYTAFATSVAAIFEFRFRHNVMFALLRSSLTLLQGTWFWQIAFELYPPFGHANLVHQSMNTSRMEEIIEEQHVHDDIMWIACVYSWHICAIFIGTVITAILIMKSHREETPRSNKNVESNHLLSNVEKLAVDDSATNSSDEDEEHISRIL